MDYLRTCLPEDVGPCDCFRTTSRHFAVHRGKKNHRSGLKRKLIVDADTETIWAGDFVISKLEQSLTPEFVNLTYFNSTVKSDASKSPKSSGP